MASPPIPPTATCCAARRPEVQRRRFAGRVHPAPRPRRAQARELAERAGLRWPVPVEHAPVLAAGPGAGRLVGAAAGAPRLKHVPRRRDARRDSMRRALFLWSPGLARGSDGGWKRGDGRRCGAISVGTNPRAGSCPTLFASLFLSSARKQGLSRAAYNRPKVHLLAQKNQAILCGFDACGIRTQGCSPLVLTGAEKQL